ncbi:hypothetical protein MMPV_003961 [Pyropia vietnamensis]
MRRSRVTKPGRVVRRSGGTTMHTRVTDQAVLFYTAASVFSNFHPAPFVMRPYLPLRSRPAGAGRRPTVEAPPSTPVAELLNAATDPSRPAVRFGHAEQFLMAAKAAVFADTPSLDMLLAARDITPAAAKRAGRAVVGFDQAAWNAEVREVAFVTCLAKFSSSPERKAALLDTLPHSRRLVEASPRDRVWGVGLGIANPDAEVPSKWRGRNLLGEALERVRAVLAAQPPEQ